MANGLFPFVYREGTYVKFKKDRVHVSIASIRAMIEKHFLDEIDTAILLHLQKYIYLNAFLVKILLGRQLAECNAEYCKKRLLKLEKMGLISRFQFIYSDEKDIEHATPFVYCLSAAGKRIFPCKDDKMNITMDINKVQCRLAYNQFHIMFENQYNDVLIYSSYAFNHYFDGIYKLPTSKNNIIFYVMSIRAFNGWEKYYLDRLREFNTYVANGNLSYSGLLVVCESEYQSLKAERSRSGDSTLSNIEIYYVCDYAAVAEGCILDYLISVNPEDNYSSYEIIKINIEGHIMQNVALAE